MLSEIFYNLSQNEKKTFINVLKYLTFVLLLLEPIMLIPPKYEMKILFWLSAVVIVRNLFFKTFCIIYKICMYFVGRF